MKSYVHHGLIFPQLRQLAILGVKTVFCDVDQNTFNVTAEFIEPIITKKTKAIVVFTCMVNPVIWNPYLILAKKHNLKVIEDNAQAIGCDIHFLMEKKNTLVPWEI